ncbi:MAG TPA: cytochrome c oxidase subunit II [Actinomycetota bacterium]
MLLAAAAVSCNGDAPSVLDPQGESAQRIDGLWWLMLWISLAVLAVVAGLMAVAFLRGRREGLEVDASSSRWGEPFVVVAGVIVPVVILTGVFVVSVRDLNAITREGDDAELTIEVVGHMWWWEARYPGGAVTANEIHIPTGQTVRFEVTTVDVIHSFWVPQLAPKIDMVPGRTNVVDVRTGTPGTYRGQCAEYCGLQHANMALFVVAEPPGEFERWLENETAPAASPADQAGLDAFLRSSCVGCHTVRGTDASGTLGPDLTHVASRETLGAGTIENTRENLADWIANPQTVKPGAVMPPTEISAEELDLIVEYLQGLT